MDLSRHMPRKCWQAWYLGTDQDDPCQGSHGFVKTLLKQRLASALPLPIMALPDFSPDGVPDAFKYLHDCVFLSAFRPGWRQHGHPTNVYV